MTEQPLDLRRSMQIVRRHWVVVSLVGLLGGLAGAAYTLHAPPLVSSISLVSISTPNTATTDTQAVVAGQDQHVLAGAVRRVGPTISVLTLGKRLKVSAIAPGILSITAEGRTATEAERTADAVASSYLAYLDSKRSYLGAQAAIIARATSATGPSLIGTLVTTGVVGALAATFVAAVGALALNRRDGRLRLRDEIADAIGVPVLASISVDHPSNVGRWSRLLESYRPGAADAWRLRSTLHHLRLADGTASHAGSERGRSLTVISLAGDKRALALGPQLAVYAASLGLPTMLVFGPQQDVGVAAALRSACAAAARSSRLPSKLNVTVADNGQLAYPPKGMLTVVVAVVDERAPQFAATIPTEVAVLGVSAGATSADQLARAAAQAGAVGLEIEGVLVADPDESDPTTGRIPRIGRNVNRMRPTRLTGTTTETGL